MLLAPHVQDDGLVVLVGGDGDHAGLRVVPVHGDRGVSTVLKPARKLYFIYMVHSASFSTMIL